MRDVRSFSCSLAGLLFLLALPFYGAAADGLANRATQSRIIPAPDSGGIASIFPWSDASQAHAPVQETGLTRGHRNSTATAQSRAQSAGVGNSHFELASSITVQEGPTSIVAVDLNGDGDEDLVTTNFWSATLSFVVGDGQGHFTTIVGASFEAIRPTWVAAADMDNDGDPDLVVTFWDGWNWRGTVAILRNQGNYVFDVSPGTEVGFFPVHVALRDWDGDGFIDVATAQWFGFNAALLHNNAGIALERVALLESGPYPASTAFADLDGDGQMQLLIGGFECNAATVYEYQSGTWVYEREIGVQWNALYVSALGLDRNASPDIAIASGQGAAAVLINDGRASFETWRDFPTLASPIHVLPADLDRDGLPDLLTTHFISSAVTPLLNRGAAGFVSITGAADVATGFGAGGGATAAATADFNGDGWMDVATADYWSDSVTLLFGVPGGGFRSRRAFAAGSLVNAMVVADFDRDGWDDLAVTNPAIGRIALLRGHPDGSFGPVTQFQAGRVPHGLAVGDLNGDGAPDLACSNQLDGTVSILLNTGSGSFQPRVAYLVGDEPFDIAIGDLDGDGRPEIGAANHSEGSIGILRNVGNGGFEAGWKISGVPLATGVAFVDLDGDADLDVVSTTYDWYGGVRGWRNSGTGSLEPLFTVSIPAGPWKVGAASIFGNSELALLVVGRLGSTISVLRLRPDGTPWPSVDVPCGANPAGVVATDYDGDGDLDLATANFNGNSVTLIENRGSALVNVDEIPIGRQPEAIASWGRSEAQDLCVALYSDRAISVLRSDRSGTVSVGATPTEDVPRVGMITPNPTRRAIAIPISMPTGTRSRLSIVDVLGREVVCLGREFEGGSRTVRWDSTNGRGQTVPPGIYFAVLRSLDRSASARFVVMR